MYAGPSNFIESVDSTFLFVLIVSVFFLVLITALMIFFVVKYNRKRNPKAVNVHSNLALEITWTVIPTILVLIMFWYGWVGYMDMAEAPENSLKVDVTAQMWKWSFKYENGTTTDTLYVPVNRPVKLNLNSLDVNHALFIPAFRVKKDVLPGQDRFVWFESGETGSYDIACAEYCGLNHSYMYSKVVVLAESEYKVWADTAGKSSAIDSLTVSK
ncbi:MAG: cytochrome c oxidase subunit II [Ignavibacteriales bacterium]|nr:MAG: cytochrome c oxidase subunit II [Ignavibacteriales bacterium]